MDIRDLEHFTPPISAANYEAHIMACVTPRPGVESALTSMAKGIGIYAQLLESPDGVLTPHLGKMLSAFRGLLNGNRGRLDGGSLSRWASHVAEAIGWNLDLEEMTW